MYWVTPNYIVVGGVSAVSILKECEFGLLLLLHCSRLGLHCEVRLEACSHVEMSDLSLPALPSMLQPTHHAGAGVE